MIALFVITIVNTIINAQALFMQYDISLRIKTALISAIYRKSLRLSSNGRKEMTIGETTNLIAIDAQKFMDVVPFLNMIWTSPLGIILCMYFLWGLHSARLSYFPCLFVVSPRRLHQAVMAWPPPLQETPGQDFAVDHAVQIGRAAFSGTAHSTEG